MSSQAMTEEERKFTIETLIQRELDAEANDLLEIAEQLVNDFNIPSLNRQQRLARAGLHGLLNVAFAQSRMADIRSFVQSQASKEGREWAHHAPPLLDRLNGLRQRAQQVLQRVDQRVERDLGWDQMPQLANDRRRQDAIWLTLTRMFLQYLVPCYLLKSEGR